ncbi:MAG: hypothetical protein A3E00_09465 [Curvibacter sp. RIFCSPHIGHO2_12_FULL_63_18]|uniref:COG4315 family predicted lipoprotein n=1 Tax=Rhodoferax sp. TaxID=50421 RepID=UPI0008B9B39B|nr:hypothetical protein [Rhodoferax sp.]OGO95283.1 MAG: hypothetical protein A2037_07155 [Curvibacter sp. GWA2_63_95]OGO99236.1 MAG: hypothetical protein A3E00_09465 [Curvibacter sp. RIFCSPHIGHO2_12_FULL_63_18]HCX81214.1 hypothetical protein [Rhodoferax sp.]
MTKHIISLALLTLLTAAVQAQPVVRDGVLADAAGRTVYIFDKDTPGKSNCSGGCLTAWPAFVAKDGATPVGDFTLIDANGAKQWAVKGKPLYYFVGDTKPGDRNGEGSGGVWHTVGGAAKASATSGTY